MNLEINPANIIVHYAWAVLQANDSDTWNVENYGNKVPIVPLSEEPELSEYSGPHIVYGYAIDSTGELHARNNGSTTFAVYDQNFRRLTKTLNTLQAAFERQDESARDVNRFSSTIVSGETNSPFIGIRFGTISVGFHEGGTPEETEGGRQSGLINIKYEYYTDYTVTTSVSR